MQRAQTVIADDPVRPGTTNAAGVLAFSAAYEETMRHATNRTSELYINLADHPQASAATARARRPSKRGRPSAAAQARRPPSRTAPRAPRAKIRLTRRPAPTAHAPARAHQLDALGFSPIARVVSGMATVRSFYAGYGELSDACALHGFRPCDGPAEQRILRGGNAYLDAGFPLLTRIHTATLVRAASRPPAEPARSALVAALVVALVALVVALTCRLAGRLVGALYRGHARSRAAIDIALEGLPWLRVPRRVRLFCRAQLAGPQAAARGGDLELRRHGV